MNKNSDDRLAADVLLGAPWLLRNGAENIDSCAAIVREWLVEKRLNKDREGADEEEDAKDGDESKK